MKNYLIGSMVLIIVAIVLALAHADVRRAVAEEFKDVRVINTESLPAKVRDVDNPARQPVQAFAFCSTTAGAFGCFNDIFAVPVGKRLVIEYASMDASLMPGDALRGSIITSVGGEQLEHRLTPTPPAINTSTSAGQEVRLYADPETTVHVHGVRSNSDGHGVFIFTISG